MPQSKKAVKAAKVFSAKVEVTKKDARKLNPLTKFWEDKIQDAFTRGMVVGGVVVFIADLLVRALSV